VPRLAFRETLVNAIAHRDYTNGNAIQIKIYPNEVYIYSHGGFPEGWTVETLLSKHASATHNPRIATTFLRAGFIDSWGSGMERIQAACEDAKSKMPTFRSIGRDLTVIFEAAESSPTSDVIPPPEVRRKCRRKCRRKRNAKQNTGNNANQPKRERKDTCRDYWHYLTHGRKANQQAEENWIG
jgi:ATP-dependent DNA helicase RecG